MIRLPAVQELLATVFLVTLCAIGSSCGKVGPELENLPSSRSTPANEQRITGVKVVKVIDGVTIDVAIEGQVQRVRYMGIEIPQLSADGVPISQKAYEANRFMVWGRTIELERDSVESDSQGNFLRYAYVDGEMVNESLLTSGYARVSTFPSSFKFQTEFLVAEQNARASGRGLWNAQPNGSPSAVSGQAAPTGTPRFAGTLPPPNSPLCDGSDSSKAIIKGKLSGASSQKLYYLTTSPGYSTIQIDESKGDRWFCKETDALAAGWSKGD